MTLLDGPAIAAQLAVSPQAVRTWAYRGHIHQRGRDEAGRALFEVAEVLAYVSARRGGNAGVGATVTPNRSTISVSGALADVESAGAPSRSGRG